MIHRSIMVVRSRMVNTGVRWGVDLFDTETFETSILPSSEARETTNYVDYCSLVQQISLNNLRRYS